MVPWEASEMIQLAMRLLDLCKALSFSFMTLLITPCGFIYMLLGFECVLFGGSKKFYKTLCEMLQSRTEQIVYEQKLKNNAIIFLQISGVQSSPVVVMAVFHRVQV